MPGALLSAFPGPFGEETIMVGAICDLSYWNCRWKRVGDPSALARAKRLSANVRLMVALEAEALMANFGSEAFAVACKRAEEASSEMLAADWREVGLTIARKDQKADRPSPATDLGSSWPF
jgi:hypothetical protein